jgi:hypothetical protein
MDNFKKLIFVNKKPNGLRFGCTFPSNVVDLIETNIDMEEKFEEFEGTFQQNEILKNDENNIFSFSSVVVKSFHSFDLLGFFSHILFLKQ